MAPYQSAIAECGVSWAVVMSMFKLPGQASHLPDSRGRPPPNHTRSESKPLVGAELGRLGTHPTCFRDFCVPSFCFFTNLDIAGNERLR